MACLNGERIKHDAAVQILALERDWTRIAYVAFGRWLLLAQPDNPNLAKTFAAHFPFFAHLDSAIAEVHTLQGDELLQHFSVAELRKHLLPVRFLGSYIGVVLDEDAKKEKAERNRIAEKLIAMRREPHGPLLKRYVDWLDGQKMSTRTKRLYLTAASQFCQAESLTESQPCREDQLQRFLRRHRGSRASLYRWITFCQKALGWDIKMPAVTSQKNAPPKTVRDLASLLAKINAAGLDHAPMEALQRAVAKAFGFPAKRMAAPTWALRTQGNELYLSDMTESVRVPTSLRDLVTMWMHRASTDASTDMT
ncbi:hypothetical protein [Rhodanobacter umsongensis]